MLVNAKSTTLIVYLWNIARTSIDCNIFQDCVIFYTTLIKLPVATIPMKVVHEKATA